MCDFSRCLYQTSMFPSFLRLWNMIRWPRHLCVAALLDLLKYVVTHTPLAPLYGHSGVLTASIPDRPGIKPQSSCARAVSGYPCDVLPPICLECKINRWPIKRYRTFLNAYVCFYICYVAYSTEGATQHFTAQCKVTSST